MTDPVADSPYQASLQKTLESFWENLSGGLPFLQAGIDDTSVVLLGTSLVDELLKFALLSGFHAPAVSNTLVEGVFKGDGPLSRFSDRIKLCTALGLVRDDIRHDLTILRSVRNDFAHSYTTLRLADYQALDSLKITSNVPIIQDDEPRRLKFKRCCAAMLYNLSHLTLMYIAKDRFVSKNLGTIQK